MTDHYGRGAAALSTLPANSPVLPAASTPSTEAYCTSGTSPTLHLIGAGAVGCELLDRFTDGSLSRAVAPRLVAVTDSTATVHDRSGLNPAAIARFKRAGGSLSGWAGGSENPLAATAIGAVAADLVVDCAPTLGSGFGRQAAVERGRAALRSGAALVLASKDGLCAASDEWLAPTVTDRLGIHAVLGGAGRQLQQQLSELRERTQRIACAGNASTTAILEFVEQGRGSLDQGIAEAARLGLLETDPELDLLGVDAAIKLAIVAGAVTGRPVDPGSIHCQDLRSVDPDEVRARVARGATTRLVGRFERATSTDSLRLGYEEVARASVLAVPANRVVYAFEFGDCTQRVHSGSGLGPARTAAAAWADLERLAVVAQGGAR